MTIKTILFPVDFSDRARASAPFILSMARRYGARVIALHAYEPVPPMYDAMSMMYPDAYDFTEVQSALQKRLVEFAAEELPKVDTACVVEIGAPAAVIIEYAETHRVDLIAMPTHGHGAFRRALLGSVTAKVLHDAKAPVWTDAHAPEPSHRAHPQPRHILAALDLNQESAATLEAALQLARDAGAAVEVVHIAPEGQTTPEPAGVKLREIMAEAAQAEPVNLQQTAPGVETVVDSGSISKLLREMALRKRTDLIVIGRGSIEGLFGTFRSHAYAIVQDAPCPVLSI